jgi:hypothetical protein
LRQAKVEIVELSHTTAEGHDMIEAHKLLLCLAEHFASSLKNYQVLHPHNTHTNAPHARAQGRTHSQPQPRSVLRSNRAHDDARGRGRGGVAAALLCADGRDPIRGRRRRSWLGASAKPTPTATD